MFPFLRILLKEAGDPQRRTSITLRSPSAHVDVALVADLIRNPKSLIPSCANALLTALLAPVCAVCNALLDEPWSGCVCGRCWRSILPITPPICDRCGDPVPRSEERCANCANESLVIRRARAIGEYEGPLREIIHALKYAGRLSLARLLAGHMRRRGTELLSEVDYVVPVPLHWRREYQRGFNQARELAQHLGPPVLEALRRRRATRAQVELPADHRRTNVAGAFVIRRRSWGLDIRGTKLLLIDDVSTTGATLESCARVLKDAGASDVYALTAARVIRKRPARLSPPPIPEAPIPNLSSQSLACGGQALQNSGEHLIRDLVF